MQYPKEPGCYLFKDSKGIILYVGKAKNLNKRISSYFSKKHTDQKTIELVKRIKDIDYFITKTEVEALILENNLIKKHLPKYNILLKDAKRYAYLQITDENFPRLVLSRKRTNKGKYFGPFVSADTRDYILETLRRTFKIRTCKRFPKKECLRYHIKICDAPCTKKISKKEYMENIKKAESVLNGHINIIIQDLKIEMKKSSDNLFYERALTLKNQIRSLSWLKEKQTMERAKKIDEDIINYIIKNDIVYLMVFNITKGIVINKQIFEFNKKENFIEDFIIQFYDTNQIPKEIIIPKKIDDSIISYLEHIRNTKVKITVPKIGEKKQLLEIVKKNIDATLFKEELRLQDLQKALKLNNTPKIIDCFDISHLHGTSTVASMVQFVNGKPNKKNYRRFKIKTVSGIDDFASMSEVVKRRYSRVIKEKEQLPSLIIIDGGKGQLSSALKELNELGIKLPIIGLAKREEEIFVPGLSFPIKLDKKRPGLLLVQAVRDEAHRFAIKYNRLLRKIPK